MSRILVAVVAVCMTVPALAGVKEKKKKEYWAKQVTDSRDYKGVTKECGAEMKFTLDDALVKSFMKTNRSLGALAEIVYGSIHTLCKDADYKAAINGAFTSVVFKEGGTKEPNRATFEMKGKVLTVGMHPEVSNTASVSRTYLEDNL